MLISLYVILYSHSKSGPKEKRKSPSLREIVSFYDFWFVKVERETHRSKAKERQRDTEGETRKEREREKSEKEIERQPKK